MMCFVCLKLEGNRYRDVGKMQRQQSSKVCESLNEASFVATFPMITRSTVGAA
jgi:hypothetical protein